MLPGVFRVGLLALVTRAPWVRILVRIKVTKREQEGFLAEWSKALDSSSSLHCRRGFESHRNHFWIPRVSNGELAQSVECVVCNDEARGSKPRFSTLLALGAEILSTSPRHQDRNPASPPFTRRWHLGRVVKAVDSKSTGLCPRKFESCRCRYCLPA